ncbi:MAG: alpha/beta hydrolase [Alphaproteobacteria bacterium]|nr:alpha/beta hydrolase [Alphaproteobacteria bacterium]
MSVQYLERDNKPKLAYRYTPASGTGKSLPVVIFLGGYRSDMEGTKAQYLEAQCAARGQGYIRFDYSGHGQSEGTFDEGTIGIWLGDALDIIEHIASGPVVLVGSSMGGWIALLVARARPAMVHALVGIAAAPDFTEDIYRRLNGAQRQELEENGIAYVPNDYSDVPYAFTKAFYEEAKDHLLLHEIRHVNFSMRLIQGGQDKDVPWQTATRIQEAYEGAELDVVIIEDGDHRLSRSEDLEVIDKEIKSVSGIL